MPTFLAVENEGLQESTSLEGYFAEYDSKSQRFKDNLSFQYLCHLKDRRRPLQQYRDGGFLHGRHHTMHRFFLPNFDGLPSFSAKAWVEKLDIYFQLNKVPEVEAINIFALHFDGEAHNWWFHGLSTLGHSNVSIYAKFTRRLVERFDRKDPEAPFISLEKLKQTRDAEAYISEFFRLSVMVPNISVARRVYMFIDGLEELLHGLVKSTKPTTLHDSIERTRDLQDALPREKATLPSKVTHSSKGKEGKDTLPKESSQKKLLDNDL